jgi:uncharacterized protein (DUF1778 family)
MMARLTVRLPDSLHDTLSKRAEAEGVSMNQFLVYALTQVAAVDLATEQRARFQTMRTRYAEEDAEAALKSLLDDREH